MNLVSILMLLLGITSGALFVFFLLRRDAAAKQNRIQELLDEQARLSEEVSRMEERSDSRQSRIDTLEQERRDLELRNTGLHEQLTEAKTTNRHLQEKLDSFKKEIAEIQESYKDQFKVLANEILEEKSKRFSEQNRTGLEQLLTPLGEKIKSFEKKVEDTYKEDVRDRISLKEQIAQLSELNSKMTEEAGNLTRALKGETKSQGSWGEVILERILEKSGLQKDREYVVQPSFSDDGKRRQPDVVVHLPDNKQLVIDSKVSLVAFEKYVSADDEQERSKTAQEHIRSVRRHVRDLSDKNYQNLYGINSPDFVLLFLPIEPAFGLAIQLDPELYNDAFDKNIVIVSPTTLLATLATISNIWKQEYQNRNAMEIAEAGGRLYDKFVGFAEDLTDLGNRISQTQKSYDGAMNKLSDGRGNLVRQAERLRELGARASKTLPASLQPDPDSDD
ncbi:DNA recombination protein RmuC [Balneolales bacterium ANBcel1]|nr:DNA recombination protein RmuC [Balneolales bacterium ANBcel1]